MANEEIRKKAKEKKIPVWRIAFEVGISESTLTRWFRVELPPDKKQQIIDAIDCIAERGE